MRYFVSFGERTLEVDVEGDVVRVDGVELSADLAALPGSELRSLLVDGRSYLVQAAREERRGAWRLRIDGVPLEADVADERTRAIRSLTGGAAGERGPRPVRAPMPGLVIRIEVEVGDRVAAGDGVAIIEAMKMENELKAESTGRVARIHVSAGDAVEKGALLVELEAE